MKRLLIALLCATALPAQTPVSPRDSSIAAFGKDLQALNDSVAVKPRFAIMDDYVRDFLSADWDKHSKDPQQNERAFCLRYQLDVWAGEPAYRVTQIENAAVSDSTVASIVFSCPRGPGRATLHVHPNTTCFRDGYCFIGGPYAWQCLESDTDTRTLNHSGDAFGMIQCSREAVITFWPKSLPSLFELLNMRSGSIVKDRRASPFSYRRDQI